MAKKQPRFIEGYTQHLEGTTKVLIDVVTGVNYLYHERGYSGGLCVLVDADGLPVVTPRELLPQYTPQ